MAAQMTTSVTIRGRAGAFLLPPLLRRSWQPPSIHVERGGGAFRTRGHHHHAFASASAAARQQDPTHRAGGASQVMRRCSSWYPPISSLGLLAGQHHGGGGVLPSTIRGNNHRSSGGRTISSAAISTARRASLDFQPRRLATSGGGKRGKKSSTNKRGKRNKAKLKLDRPEPTVTEAASEPGLILPGSPEFNTKTPPPPPPPPKTLIKSDLSSHYTDVILNQSEQSRTAARHHMPAPSLEADPSGISRAKPEDMVDLKSLYDPSVHLPDKPDFATDTACADDGSGRRIGYEVGTPLCDELVRTIGVRGPITVAEYMRMALRHPTLGYYTGGGRGKDELEDVFDDDDSEYEEEEDGGKAGEGDDWDNDWDQDGDAPDASSTTTDAAASSGKAQEDGSKVIGPRGDFTTAPEISQIFGESLLVWYLTQYQSAGCPSQIQLIEIGPGRGTLMCDMLRSVLTGGGTAVGEASGVWDQFAAALCRGGGVHLVEVGRALRLEQRNRLAELGASKLGGYGFELVDSECDYDDKKDEESDEKMKKEENKEEIPKDIEQEQSKEDNDNNVIKIQWHDVLADVPSTLPAEAGGTAKEDEPVTTFIVCQEIIDALPVHSFQKTENGWRERLVDVAVREEEPSHVKRSSVGDAEVQDESNLSDEDKVAAAKQRFAAAQIQNSPPAARKRYSDAEAAGKAASSPDSSALFHRKPRLRFVLPPDTTPALRTLLNVDAKSGKTLGPNAAALDNASPGDVMEVCPEGMMLAQDIASRIEKCGGAALIIDYGGEGSADTLRAFKRHKQAHPLSSPGSIDVTADVDFAALKEAVNNGMDAMRKMKRDAEQAAGDGDGDDDEVGTVGAPVAFGPVTQGKFLAAMGAVERVVALIEKDSTTDEQAEELYGALERLVQPEHMGERYKVLAITRKKDGIFAPPAF